MWSRLASAGFFAAFGPLRTTRSRRKGRGDESEKAADEARPSCGAGGTGHEQNCPGRPRDGSSRCVRRVVQLLLLLLILPLLPPSPALLLP